MKHKYLFITTAILCLVLFSMNVSANNYFNVTIGQWEGVNLQTRLAQSFDSPNTYLYWDGEKLDDFYGSNQYFYDLNQSSCSEYVGQPGYSSLSTLGIGGTSFCHYDANTSIVYHVLVIDVNDAEGWALLEINGPIQITNCTQLQNINNNLTADYVLINNIDCSDTINWNGGAGFIPIGQPPTPFTGTFDGRGYNITSLFINSTTLSSVGLFASVELGGIIKNVGLLDVYVEATNEDEVGGLIGGIWSGYLNNSFVTGTIIDHSGAVTGGVIGNGDSPVYDVWSNVNVTGDDAVGGLSGTYEGEITNSYTTGIITGSNGFEGGLIGAGTNVVLNNCSSTATIIPGGNYIGGLLGVADGSSYINNSYTNVNINGLEKDTVGGLVGQVGDNVIINNSHSSGYVYNASTLGGLVGSLNVGTIIDNSWSNTTVDGLMSGTGYAVGGLVGSNAGNITNSYTTGDVTGYQWVGGLVGDNSPGGIYNSYATGDVTGYQYVGGLAGEQYHYGGPPQTMAVINNSYSTGLVIGDLDVGGLYGYQDYDYSCADVQDSYWDNQTSNQSTSPCGTGKTTTQMKTLSTFSGWDIADVSTWSTETWKIQDGITYPMLGYQAYTPIMNFDSCVSNGSLLNYSNAIYNMTGNIDLSTAETDYDCINNPGYYNNFAAVIPDNFTIDCNNYQFYGTAPGDLNIGIFGIKYNNTSFGDLTIKNCILNATNPEVFLLELSSSNPTATFNNLYLDNVTVYSDFTGMLNQMIIGSSNVDFNNAYVNNASIINSSGCSYNYNSSVWRSGSLVGLDYNVSCPSGPVISDRTWVEQNGSGVGDWYWLTGSSDASKIFGIRSGVYNLSFSGDGGVTWSELGISGDFMSVDASSDGTKIILGETSGYVYLSNDSGNTWTQQTSLGNSNMGWYVVKVSSDGTKYLAMDGQGNLSASNDSGTTWNHVSSLNGLYFFDASSDLSKVVTGNYANGYIYTSNDGGYTWTQQNNSGTKKWNGFAMSDDGTKILAVVDIAGYIYTSNDSGVTWTEHTEVGLEQWWQTATSSDGVNLAISDYDNGYIWTSNNSGNTWSREDNAGIKSWYSIISSSDGSKLVAAAFGGNIWTSTLGGTPPIQIINFNTCNNGGPGLINTSNTIYNMTGDVDLATGEYGYDCIYNPGYYTATPEYLTDFIIDCNGYQFYGTSPTLAAAMFGYIGSASNITFRNCILNGTGTPTAFFIESYTGNVTGLTLENIKIYSNAEGNYLQNMVLSSDWSPITNIYVNNVTMTNTSGCTFTYTNETFSGGLNYTTSCITFNSSAYNVTFPHLNEVFTNNPNLTYGFTNTDPYYSYATYTLYNYSNNYTTNFSTTDTNHTFNLKDGKYYYALTIYDLYGNYQYYDPNITIDTTPPSIVYNVNTTRNNTNGISTNIYVSINITEENPNITTINLYNASGTLINTTSTTSNGTFDYTFTVAQNKVYYFNATSTDQANNTNSTPTYRYSTITCSSCNETCSPCGGGCTDTDFTNQFKNWNAAQFSALGNISGWNTSCITNMNSAFDSASGYGGANSTINNWDTSNVTSMISTFEGSNQFKLVSNWNTSKVTSMSRMFANGGGDSLGSIANWDTSNLVDMSYMFYNNNYCGNGLFGNWDTHNVTNMYYALGAAGNCVPTVTNWNTSQVTNMGWLFLDAAGVNGAGHFDTSQVTNMDGMFYLVPYNENITGWNTSKVTSMNSMFKNSNQFNQSIGVWDVSKVTNMNAMFQGASSFTQNLSNWNTSNVNTMANMFLGANKYNQPLNTWDTHNVTDMSAMFQSATLFNQPLNAWNTSRVTTMANMFNSASNFNQSLSTWDVSQVTTMASMFSLATKFDQDIGAWNVSNVTTMATMFNGVTLSTLNYNALLVGWASRSEKNAVTFNAGSSKYSAAGLVGRNILTGTYNWSITDGSLSNVTFNSTQYNVTFPYLNNIYTTNTTLTYGFVSTDPYYAYATYTLTNYSNGFTTNASTTNTNYTFNLLDGKYYYALTIFDLYGNSGYYDPNITIDTTNPNISYTATSTQNNSLSTNKYIYVSVNISDPNINVTTINLYNSSGSLISTKLDVNTPSGSCYQESANITNQSGIDGACELKYTGSYTGIYSNGTVISYSGCANNGAFDFCQPPSDLDIYINYTKPVGATSDSKVDVLVRLEEGTQYNQSIPISCWNYNTDTLVLARAAIGGSLNGGFGAVALKCYNGSNWLDIYNSGKFTLDYGEEAVRWDISSVGSNGVFSKNFTNLNAGLYYWNATSTDLAGNQNSTSTYTGRVLLFNNGTGTTGDPYQITNCAELQEVMYPVNASFKVMNDIDCNDTINWNNGSGFVPIGQSGFLGYFNGSGKTISNLYINRPTETYCGLFGITNAGTIIENVGLTNLNMSCYNYIGGIVGKGGHSVLRYSFTTGNIQSFVPGYTYGYVGGVIGRMNVLDSGTTYDCYSKVNVSGGGQNGPGGFVGTVFSNAGVTRSYSTGKILPSNIGGGFVQDDPLAKVSNSFWDNQTSGKSTSGAGIGKTTFDMKKYNTFLNAGWNMTDTWQTCSGVNEGYPSLRVFGGYNASTCNILVFSGSGYGNSSDPFQITNCTQLQEMKLNLNASYKIMNNINCSETITWNSGAGFDPIGDATNQFQGYLNGSGKIINGLYMVHPDYNTGLFGYIGGSGIVENLGLTNVNISNSAWGQYYVGGMAGTNNGNIKKSFTTGYVHGYHNDAGGMVGMNYGYIYDSYSTAEVFAFNRYAGFAGENNGGNIQNSYSTGYVPGNTSPYYGGFIALGVAGVSLSYWDVNTSGQPTSYQGIGKTTTEMKDATTFAGWDLGTTWQLCDSTNNGYPSLVIFGEGSTCDYGLGKGTTLNPYRVTNCTLLQDIGSGNSTYYKNSLNASFKIMNNIDCSATTTWNAGAGFLPIGGYNNGFTGTLEGQHYNITNLYINKPSDSFIGFFSQLNGTVKNVNLKNINVTGLQWVGGLIGLSYGTVFNSSTTGRVTGNPTWQVYWTGGLIGKSYGNISYSYSEANVVCNGCQGVGGLVGGQAAGIITDSYATGNASAGSGVNVGGFIGQRVKEGAVNEVYNSYSTGRATAIGNAGGFVGRQDAGLGVGGATNCYWDTQTSGLNNDGFTASGATGLTTKQMKTQSTFTSTSWNFNTIWQMFAYDNNGYPSLQGITSNSSLYNNVTYWNFNNSRSSGKYVDAVILGGENNTLDYFNNPTPTSVTLANVNYGYAENTSMISGTNFRFDTNYWCSVAIGSLSGPSCNISIGFDFKTKQSTINMCRVFFDGIWYIDSGCGRDIAINSYGDNGWHRALYLMQTISGTDRYSEKLYIDGVLVTSEPEFYYNLGGMDDYHDPSFALRTLNNTTYVDDAYIWKKILNTSEITEYFSTYSKPSLSGSGTSFDPYEIHNCTELQAVNNNNLSAYYKVMNNIDCSATPTWNGGAGFLPIGNGSSFDGNFNGSGYNITNLYINRSADSNVGLFSRSTIGTIYDIRLVNVNITGGTNTGGLIGYLDMISSSVAVIRNSTVSGRVIGGDDVGGLIGRIRSASVYTSMSSATVSGGNYVGGFVGYATSGGFNAATISQCYSTGNVSAAYATGGFAGWIYSIVNIQDAYATGSVTGGSASYPDAGFTGWLDNGYSTVGRIYSTGLVTNPNPNNAKGLIAVCGTNFGCNIAGGAFWDNQTSNRSISAAGTGKTTYLMKTTNTFIVAGWDMNNTWQVCPDINNGYPSLRVFGGFNASTCNQERAFDNSSYNVSFPYANNAYTTNTTLTYGFTTVDPYFSFASYLITNLATNITTNVSTTNTSYTTTLADGRYYYALTLNDFLGKGQYYDPNITIDTIYPTISYAANSVQNNSYLSTPSIFVNITMNDTNTNTTTINLYNETNNLIGSMSATPGTCYQETHNASNPNDGSCGLSYTGTTQLYAGFDTGYMINYTKPSGVDNASKWNYKIASYNGTTINRSVTIPSACWNYNANYVVVGYYLSMGAGGEFYTACYGPSGIQYIEHIGNIGSGTGSWTSDLSNMYDANWNTGLGWGGFNQWFNPPFGGSWLAVYEDSMTWNIPATNTLVKNFTGLTNGIYYWNATISDLVGHINNTQTYKATIITSFQSQYYTVTFPYPNDVYTTNNTLTYGFTTIDPYYNYTVYNLLNYSNNITTNSTTNNQNRTQTMIDGKYYYGLTIFDLAGNSYYYDPNITIDTTPPVINYSNNSVQNNSYLNTPNIFVNVTITEVNPNVTSISLYNNTGNLIGSVSTLQPGSYCYQESANVSNQTGIDGNCGQVYTGTYSQWATSQIDGNWNTGIQYGNYAVVTYKIPNNVDPLKSIWMVKDDGGIQNLTLTNCAGSISGNNITLTAWDGGYYYCLNATGGFQALGTQTYAKYEEAMYWYNKGVNTFSTTFTNLSNGIYYWNATTNDLVGYTSSTPTYKATIIASFQNTSYTVTFPYPNNAYTTNNTLTYGFSTTDPYYSYTVYTLTNYSNNATANISTSDMNKTQVLADGKYYYALRIYDLANNNQYYDPNITIDTIYPSLVYNANTTPNNSYVGPSANIYVSVSMNDTNINTTIINLYNSSGSLLSSINSTSNGVLSNNFTGLTNGVYYWNVTTTDLVGQITILPTRMATIITSFQSQYYTVTFPYANNAYTTNTTLTHGFTHSDPYYNYSVYTLTNITGGGGTTNITTTNTSMTRVLVDGKYYYGVRIYDKAGNNYFYDPNITIDTTPPSLVYNANTAANNSYVGPAANIYVSVNTSDTNIQETRINLYNSVGGTPIAYQWINYNGTLSKDFTGLTNGVYYFNVTAIDYAGLITNLPTRTVIIITSFQNQYYNVTFPYTNEYYTNNNTLTYGFTHVDPYYNYTQYTLTNYSNNVTTNTTTPNLNKTQLLSDGKYYYGLRIYDLAGNNQFYDPNVTIDTTKPLIEFINFTEINGSTVDTRTYLNVTINTSDTNYWKTDIYMYNSTGLQDQYTSYTPGVINKTFNISLNGWYYLNATTTDYAGNTNNTDTRAVYIDTWKTNITFNAFERTTNNTIPYNVLFYRPTTSYIQNWTNTTVNDGSHAFLNPTNAFDGNTSTAASVTISTGQGLFLNPQLGQTYNETVMVTNVYWNLRAQTNDGGSNTIYVYLETYNGSTWATATTLYSVVSNPNPIDSGIISGTYALNQNVKGVRIRYNIVSSTSQVAKQAYLYELNPTISPALIAVPGPLVDNVSVTNRTLTTQLIKSTPDVHTVIFTTPGAYYNCTYLWIYQSDYEFPTCEFYTTQTTMYAYNSYTNTTINNFTVNAGLPYTYPSYSETKTDGSNVFFNLTNPNAYILSFTHPYYLSKTLTYTPTGMNQTINNSMNQSAITLRFYHVYSNELITNINITVNDTSVPHVFNTNSTGMITFNPNTGSHLLVISGGRYNTLTYNLTVADQDTRTIDINLYPILNISVYEEKQSMIALSYFNFSHPRQFKWTVYCLNESGDDIGTQQAIISNTTSGAYFLNATCYYERVKFDLEYLNGDGTTTNYYRNVIFLPTINLFDFRTFIPDLALGYNIYPTTLKPYDIFGVYTTGSHTQVQVTKIMPTGTELITSDYVDAEGKITAYLIAGDTYIITILADDQPIRVLGPYNADASGTKILRLFDVTLVSDQDTQDKDISTLTRVTNQTDNQSLIIMYYSNHGEWTYDLTMTLYNGTCNDPKLSTSCSLTPTTGCIMTTTHQDESQLLASNRTVLMTTNVFGSPYMNKQANTYYCALYNYTDYENIVHLRTDDITYDHYIKMPAEDYMDTWTMPWIILLLIVIIALGLNVRTVSYGSLLITFLAMMLYGWGWFNGVTEVAGLNTGLAFTVAILIAIAFNIKRQM